MPQGVYDQASRFAARIDPPGLLGWLLGLPADAFAFRGWLDTRAVPFPGDPGRTNDTVARLDDPATHGIPWAVAVEWQARPNPDMFGRLTGYLSGLWLGLRPDDERGSRFHVGAAVVNLTGSGTSSREMRWPAARLVTHLEVVERNLERESAADLLAGVESGQWPRCVLPWVPLMAGGDSPEIVGRWVQLAGAEPDPRRRADLASLAQLFAERAGRKNLWHEKLRRWNVEESALMNEWMAKFEARGLALGEARGLALGESRGAAEEARKLVLRLGAKRSGPASVEIEGAIRAIPDCDHLERLVERILDAAGWDDLPGPAATKLLFPQELPT